nr:GDP-mannose 4,6-dehydratase [uncultured Lachnoclostridium sp.]
MVIGECFKGHNIFLTGGTGFVGSHMAEHMVKAGANVTILVENINAFSYFHVAKLEEKVKLVYGKIQDSDLLEQIIVEGKIDTIFHLAAVALQDLAYQMPKTTFDVNIMGTYNLLEVARKHQDIVKQVLVASSDKVYGDSDILPYTEDLPIQGENPYDVSKACEDMLARSYYHSYGLPVVVGRFGNIYGPGDNNFNRLVPNTIASFARKEKPLVRKPEKGTYKRDFLYIKDIVRAYEHMFCHIHDEEVIGQAFNFGTGVATDIEVVVRKVQSIMKCEDVTLNVEVQKTQEILNQQLNANKAWNLLGWKAEYDIGQGLTETVDWYLENHFYTE